VEGAAVQARQDDTVSRQALAAIVGASETERIGIVPDRSAIALNAEAAFRALEDAGISVAQVDGIASSGQSPAAVAHYLGITPSWIDTTSLGGCSPLVHIRHAAAAIANGLCSTVLVTHGQSGRSRLGQGPFDLGQHPRSHDPMGWQFEAPYGAANAVTSFSIGVLRYMKTYGLTHEGLAAVPVVQRQWAAQNPRAMYRDKITVEDVLSSRLVVYPMHILECCLVTDGGGAVVLVSPERAAGHDDDRANRAVYLLGAGECCEGPTVSALEDLTSSRASRQSGAAALRQASISISDVEHVMLYDAFAHLPLYSLEDLGFVGRGEAGPFVVEGNTGPGGRLPMNTNGGGLSYTHTGMYGMFAILESVRQVRGQAAAQVPGVQISLVHGVGGMFMAAATLVLATRNVVDAR
jgi:acetyl-CoA acetyltransferase